jgi:hypothetical protein
VKTHAANPQARLLVNTKSGRAALALPAPSLTLEDGNVECRVRLIRPMERHTVAVGSLEESNWVEAGDDMFAEHWNSEVTAVPEFTTSTFHVITGLLLPIWKRLPRDNPRVYRFDTDAGERVIGRLLPVDELHRFTDETGPLSPDAAWARLQAGAQVSLAEGLVLKRAMVMHASRIELVGYHDTAVDRLKAMGLVSEIIAWRLRLFVPTGETGLPILTELLRKYPGKVSHA